METTTLNPGTAGLNTQGNGMPTTVSGAAAATGGVSDANLIGVEVDKELFQFNTEDTPLMNLMLKAKRVNVSSPEVDHYMLDEAKSTVTTVADCCGTGAGTGILSLRNGEGVMIRPFTTLLVKGVNGYDREGAHETPGRDLMLFVEKHDASNNPVVRAVNGKKNTPEDEYGAIPLIPAGTTLVILANSLYETQKEVDPDLVLPQPRRIYLQKRGMNQVVSDYFNSTKKRLPFSKAVIAEQAIANFKVRGNRTLWASRAGKFHVSVNRMGMQTVYTTEGLRWQFKRELQERGEWTVDKIIALAKMFFTGEDVPKSALLLAGKDLLESIQKVDFSKHPEIHITTRQNSVGWTVTNFHTVFGDIEIKREPTLDRLGWSKSGALIGENRLVHYVYSSEHSFKDRVEGEEATRNGILIWDAIALKGTCHIWIDGETETETSEADKIILWDSEAAPTAADYPDGGLFMLSKDCREISSLAVAGTLVRMTVNGGEAAFEIVTGDVVE